MVRALALLTLSLATLGVATQCPHVSRHWCARVYDNSNCEGWRLDIPDTGRYVLPGGWFGKRNDIGHVTVRAGCRFEGYSDSNFIGDHFAITRRGWHYTNVETNIDLSRNPTTYSGYSSDYPASYFDNEIESIICYCET